MSAVNDPQRLAQLRAIVQRTRSDLLNFLNQSQQGQQGQQASGSEGPSPESGTQTSGPIEQI